MDPNIVSAIIGGAALIIGIIAGKLIFAKNTKKQLLKPNYILKISSKKRNSGAKH